MLVDCFVDCYHYDSKYVYRNREREEGTAIWRKRMMSQQLSERDGRRNTKQNSVVVEKQSFHSTKQDERIG